MKFQDAPCAIPWQHYPPRFIGYNLSLAVQSTPLRWPQMYYAAFIFHKKPQKLTFDNNYVVYLNAYIQYQRIVYDPETQE